MASFDEARRRFEAAVSRLETAAAGAGAPGGRDVAGELAETRAERDRLAARVAELEARCEGLHAATAAAASRLDGSIESVRALIGE